MFTSLAQFYNSEVWRKFRLQLISDRVNPVDGILYDEYNGKPLINSYDIVAHHKIPLTMQNVNDFSVSLNPANILLVSQKSHNEIHSRFGYCTERKVYFVHGAPCSGKTSFVKESKGNSDLVIDTDLIWNCLTMGVEYEKPKALNTNVFGVRDLLLDMVKTRAGKWERAWVISAEPLKSARDKMCERLGAEIIEIDTDKETCLERLHSNPNGRDIKMWTELIERYFGVS